jgi:hypothetical protein
MKMVTVMVMNMVIITVTATETVTGTVTVRLIVQSYLYNPYNFRCSNTRYGLFFTVNRIIRSFNKKD